MCFEWIGFVLQRLASRASSIGESLHTWHIPEQFLPSNKSKRSSRCSSGSGSAAARSGCSASSSGSHEPPPSSSSSSSAMLQQRYRFVRNLGGGAFGAVVQAEDVQSGEIVAVKKLQRAGYSSYFLSEILNHRNLCHPHVVRFHEVFLTNNHLNIVMEYANSGSLFDHVKKHRRLSEEKARWFFQQLMIAVDYCHKKGVTNRDIKLENILLHCLPGKAMPIVKLCDWGYSKLAEAGPRTAVGTVAYMAPEVLQNSIQSQQQIYDGFAADIWSCGVVLYTLLVGVRPFDDKNGADQRLLQQMADQDYQLPDILSADCRRLIRQLLQPDPLQRIKMADIHQQPWFLEGLPPGALEMCEKFLIRPCTCRQDEEEIRHIVAAAASST